MNECVDTHVPVIHKKCDLNFCQFCDGGLFACAVCGAFEGSTPDDCPGRQMSTEESDEVYAGRLNYRDGAWREECCAVMRPVHDKYAFMAEHGFAHCTCGQWNPAGDPCRWPHLHTESRLS